MKYFVGLIFFIFVSIGAVPKYKTVPPNIVLIVMDDMGYGDLSCYGSMDFYTPNIDKLASQGMRFTNFLATQAVCTASRAALLTGTYPNRMGISGAFMPYHKNGLNANETTLAEMLKKQNYATAIVGKWHLGHLPQHLPLKHGFDEYFGLPYSNDMWPVNYDGKPIEDATDARKRDFPPLPLIKNDKVVATINSFEDQDNLTLQYTQKSIEFIEQNKKNPFFLYLAHSQPHVPLGVSKAFKGKSKQGMYGDVMMELDWSVGQIMQNLQKNGLAQNTIFILTSDNGPWANYGNHAGSAAGLRQGKAGVFEGGMRVPFIVRWPGKTPAGTICNQLGANIDVLPTLANLTNSNFKGNTIDGIDFSSILKGEVNKAYRNEFYYYYAANELRAVRQGNWKLMLPHNYWQSFENVLPGNDRLPGKYETVDVPLALYDLRRDPGERYDVKDQNPKIVAELQALAEKARADLGDKLSNRKGANTRPIGE